MAKKVKVKQEGPTPDALASHFPDIPMTNEPPVREGDERKKSNDNEVLERIQSQLAELSERNKRLEETNMRLLTAPVAANDNQKPTAPGPVSYDNMPDPVDDPKAYAVELQKRMDAHYALKADHEKAQRDAQAAKQQKVAGLWSGFNAYAPEFAKDQSRVEFAATKLAEEMQSRGVDVERYMFTTQDKFFADLKAKMETIFGKAAGDGEDEDGEEDAGRTGGTFGGSVSSPKGSVRDKEPTTSNMVEELQRMQRGSRFF
jgi:hypothetical protein